jgi:hypothetical protein
MSKESPNGPTPKPHEQAHEQTGDTLSAILYAVTNPEEHRVNLYQVIRVGAHRVWIRAEIFHGGIAHALDMARPLKGEIVLNTIPLEAK